MSLARWADVDLEEFPLLQKWEERVGRRPGVEKGNNVPDVNRFKEILADPAKIKAVEEMMRKGRKYG